MFLRRALGRECRVAVAAANPSELLSKGKPSRRKIRISVCVRPREERYLAALNICTGPRPRSFRLQPHPWQAHSTAAKSNFIKTEHQKTGNSQSLFSLALSLALSHSLSPSVALSAHQGAASNQFPAAFFLPLLRQLRKTILSPYAIHLLPSIFQHFRFLIFISTRAMVRGRPPHQSSHSDQRRVRFVFWIRRGHIAHTHYTFLPVFRSMAVSCN